MAELHQAQKMYPGKIEPNSVCVNCRFAFAAHGSITQACPDRASFFAEKATQFKRFAYVPIGEWFRINASGTKVLDIERETITAETEFRP